MKTRLASPLCGCAVGAFVGAGTGIAGGSFGAVPGLGVFAGGGAIAGFLAGPDADRILRRLKSDRSEK